MSSSALVAQAPSVRIRGTTYPVLLPKLRDPRLHLAGVIVTLQVLGQTAFDFDLSIAQILVALLTSAVLEVAIAFRRQRVLLWPASALLTGNGVAFVLRVPGTEHGDWWSMNGWWIFAGTAAVSLLSKHLVTFRGRHVFNPSNFGLVLCFLLLGPERADPLAFWWGPLSPWLVLALVLIVGGGLAILSRLRLVVVAVAFWLTFAAGVGVLALSGHEMNASWHVGPITGWELWRVLVTSPEILVFLFFMITDPRTTPASQPGRRAYAVAVGFLACLLIAPWTSEFSAKVAVLAALALVCASRVPLTLLSSSARLERLLANVRGRRLLPVAGIAAAAAVGLLVVAGLPARPEAALAAPVATAALPQITVAETEGLQTLDQARARTITAALVAALAGADDALRTRDRTRAQTAGTGRWLADVWRRIDEAHGGAIEAPSYALDRVRLRLLRGTGQGPPTILAVARGRGWTTTYGPDAEEMGRTAARPVVRTFELVARGNRFLVTDLRGTRTAAVPAARASFALTDVAADVGLGFRHDAFRFGMGGSEDETAMMGGGLCWLDYDGDGRLDLYVVDTYAESDVPGFSARGGLPTSRLYRNLGDRFEDVTSTTSAGLRVRGSGCAAADLDGNGATDLFVTTAGYDAGRDAYDAVLWNEGDGTFTEGAWRAGVRAFGWHTGAAVADVNDDGLLDVFVAGYTDQNAMIPTSSAGFPANHRGVPDLLYLNEGGRRFREVGAQAGLEPRHVDHGLGAVFLDANRDGRLDLYVANDLDPNRLYLNVAKPNDPRGLGFRFVERGRSLGVDDPNAGMGVAVGDFSGDGLEDLLVTNSRGQLHAAYEGSPSGPYADARPAFARALGQESTGWGATWADLDLDGDLELAMANGAIPVISLARDAERLRLAAIDGQEVEPLTAGMVAPRNGRGLAAADYDNDGDLDLAVGTIGGRLQLLRNDGADGHWLEIAGLEPGTTVEATLAGGRRLVRRLHAGSSYLSSEDPRVHLGLGDADRVERLVVRHPGGRVTTLRDVAADRIVAVRAPG